MAFTDKIAHIHNNETKSLPLHKV